MFICSFSFLTDLYSYPQKGICSGETNRRTIKNPRLRNFVDEETMIFSRRETRSSDTLPIMRLLYARPQHRRPLSMASLYQLRQTFDDENCYTTCQQTLPITRL